MKPVVRRLMFLLLIFCTACGLFGLAGLDGAERRWKSTGVTSYTIEALEVRGVWHAQVNTVTVTDGKVSAFSAECIPAPMEGGACKVQEFDPERYTVAGLFEQARQRLQGEQAAHFKIEYDAAYGFPSFMKFDDPKAVDEEWSIGVRRFERNPEAANPLPELTNAR